MKGEDFFDRERKEVKNIPNVQSDYNRTKHYAL